MAVLVGLVASKCDKDEFSNGMDCYANCHIWKTDANLKISGMCKTTTNTDEDKYGNIVPCLKCIAPPHRSFKFP